MTPPMFSNFPESWPKFSNATRELATAFSVTFVFSNTSWSSGQNSPPPQQKVSRYICNTANFRVDLIGKVDVKFLLELASDD